MKLRKVNLTVAAASAVLLLGACGQGGETEAADEQATESASAELPGGMTVEGQIKARQKALKSVGGAFKDISDELKADAPDIAKIQAAAANIPTLVEGMENWFPEGTGPDSGVETDALPVIWESKEDFLQKTSDMQTAAANLNTVAQGGDAAAIGAAFKETGGTCKACHDKYRLDD